MSTNRLAWFRGAVRDYYINDIRGSVVKIVGANGEEFSSYEYEPSGTIIAQTGPAADFNYTGKELDEGYSFDLY